MSFEDIRDNYKSSRQSSDVKLKLNGATYRKARDAQYKNLGNLISIVDSQQAFQDLNEINAKYHMNEPPKSGNFQYSLNKKNRWNLANELRENMTEFASDNIDVRLYEKSNRINKDSNCIGVASTLDQGRAHVKKTYGNLSSLKKEYEIRNSKNGAKSESEKKPKKVTTNFSHRYNNTQKCSKPSTPTKMYERNSYNCEEDEEPEKYVQYEIEYAPKKDILKYNVDHDKIEKVGKKSKQLKFKNYLDNEDFQEALEEIAENEEFCQEESIIKRPINVDLGQLVQV